jgi:hypothetical protein
LVPMCKDCNEPPAKGQKDLLYTDGAIPQRRQVFYPYAGSGGVEIRVKCFLKPSLNDLGEWAVDITPTNPNEAEQIQTWCEVFNIKRRYEAYIAEHQKWWISVFVHSQSLSGQELEVSTLKQNMTKWKESHRFIKIQTGALLCCAFFEYLINEAEQTYLEGLCKLIGQNEIKVPL